MNERKEKKELNKLRGKNRSQLKRKTHIGRKHKYKYIKKRTK